MQKTKKKYLIYDFSTSDLDYMLKILNEKGQEGYKIIDTHYTKLQFTENVRYVLEMEY